MVRLTHPDVTLGQTRDEFLTSADGWTRETALTRLFESGPFYAIPFVGAWTSACLLVQMNGPR